MKRIFFLIIGFLIMSSCDDNKKITPYLKEKKELKLSILNEHFVTSISFIFIIDTSGSMNPFRKNLAENINLFLSPIFKKYPYYNYHFAFTTMTPENKYTIDNKPLYFENFLEECGYSKNMKLKTSNMGHYLQYSYNLSKELDMEKLFCVLNWNIIEIQGFDGGTESYFQSLDYILDKSDTNFNRDFFRQDKILTLFFISDSWHGVDYKSMLLNRIQDTIDKIAEDLADKYINKFKKFFDIQKNLRSYATVHSYELLDHCEDIEGSGEKANNYPFHVYKFIEKTNGLRLSICDERWGEKLGRISDSFLSSFKVSAFFLDEFPEKDTIEVYFNDIKIPYDPEEGWFFNPEKIAVQMGPKMNWSYYLSLDSKKSSQSEIKVLYHPLNLKILQEGSEK